MPKRTAIESLEMKGWVGGLNRDADPFQLEMDEVADCVNVDFGLRGATSKRKGYTAHTTSHSTATKATHFHAWSRLGGDDWFLYVDDTGDLWYTSGTTLIDASAAYGTEADNIEYPFAFASMNNMVYVSTLRHASTNPRSFDGTTWTSVSKAAFDGTPNQFPKAAFLVSHRERIFAFNVKTSTGTRYRSRFYWSEPATPETWEALSYIDVAPDDGQEITAARAFGEVIVIFKNHSFYILSGVDEKSFTLYPVDTAIGTEAPGTVVPIGDELFFFDHNTGVWAFTGSGFNRKDEKVNHYILDGINIAAVHKAVGFSYQNRYWLSLPWGTSTTNNRTFVYDTQIEAWTEYDFGISAGAIEGALAYGTAPRDAIGIFRLENGLTDAGSNIESFFKTLWIAPESEGVKHRIRRLDLAFSALGDYDVSVDMFRDFGLSEYIQQTVNTSPGGFIWDTSKWNEVSWGVGQLEVLTRATGWGQRWRTVAFKFGENTDGSFQVNRMRMHISTLPRVRGEP